MVKKDSPLVTKKTKSFPIVAIGASAGGQEAMVELLKHLPTKPGMALVYIQHQDPKHKSKLVEIFSRETSIPVEVAKQSSVIRRNKLYIIPSDKDISISNRAFQLVSRKPRPAAHMPVDKFFLSIAENHNDGVIGVILSGSATDGSIGLRAIKTAGGITFAQDDSALFKSMPKSAIAEGSVDMILSPKEIAYELERIGKNNDLIAQAMDIDASVGANDEDLNAIIQLLKKSTGVDFKHYKINTIKRRIIRRMLLYQLETLKDYAKYLRQHSHEINVLYQDLLINVTSFFRDLDTLEYLKKSVLPKIISNAKANEPVRIWVPACSTGEEAYSLAIILMELLNNKTTLPPIQIFATDLSELAVAKARLGVYSKTELAEVSPKRLQQYFTKIDGSYRIVKAIRDLCVFAPHNIFKDPPFSRMDLISCCNLMIYLDTVLQKKMLGTFHYALKRNGHLVLGKSETVAASGQLFSQLEKKFKVYLKKGDGSERAKFDLTYKPVENDGQDGLRKLPPNTKLLVADNNSLDKTVNDILLEKYVPASVVINQDLDILQFRGSTGLFIEPMPGKASLNLLKMAKSGLSFELRNVVHKAIKSGKTETKSGIVIKAGGSNVYVSVEAVPLDIDGEEQFYLILFHKLPHAAPNDALSNISKDKIVKQLRLELETLKDDMRSILEEQEASVEELQSANEEVVSSNEELQSINEELETSKEEVESTNEELMTVNHELQVRNEQLSEAYEYAQEVFDTIRESILVLDSDLRVRSANTTFYKTFKLTEAETEGTIIFELGDRQWDIQQLRQFFYEIIPNQATFHGYEITHEFPHIGEKVLLLNARRVVQKVHRKQIILVAIEDITEHRRAQRIMAEREMWFRNMANNAPVMIWVAGLDKKRNFLNKTWLEFTGQNGTANSKEGWQEAIHPDDLKGYLDLYNASFMERETFQFEYRLRRNDGEYRWMMDIARPTYSPEGAFLGYIGSCTELHNKKLLHDELEKRVAERTTELEEMNKELQRSNSELQQFAYVSSHDLQEPLRKIMTFADRLEPLKERLPEQGRVYVDKINESSVRMTRLIDDLLDYSRISREDAKFTTTDLNKVVKEILVDFEVTMQQKKVKLTIDPLPTVSAIPLQMEQLFHNLISNALKFSKEDTTPEVNISCRTLPREELKKHPNLEQNRSYVEIVVKDNGIGFPPEFADQIFIIFQRLNDKKNYPGTGIGLALCYKIVANHGGEIYAKSVENEGAEFYILLPTRRGRKDAQS
jgi:two-component system CheB/CheR fusion protein